MYVHMYVNMCVCLYVCLSKITFMLFAFWLWGVSSFHHHYKDNLCLTLFLMMGEGGFHVNTHHHDFASVTSAVVLVDVQ